MSRKELIKKQSDSIHNTKQEEQKIRKCNKFWLF